MIMPENLKNLEQTSYTECITHENYYFPAHPSPLYPGPENSAPPHSPPPPPQKKSDLDSLSKFTY